MLIPSLHCRGAAPFSFPAAVLIPTDGASRRRFALGCARIMIVFAFAQTMAEILFLRWNCECGNDANGLSTVSSHIVGRGERLEMMAAEFGRQSFFPRLNHSLTPLCHLPRRPLRRRGRGGATPPQFNPGRDEVARPKRQPASFEGRDIVRT